MPMLFRRTGYVRTHGIVTDRSKELEVVEGTTDEPLQERRYYLVCRLARRYLVVCFDMPYSEKQCRLFRMMAAGKAEGAPPKDWRDYCTKEGKEKLRKMSMDEYERYLNESRTT